MAESNRNQEIEALIDEQMKKLGYTTSSTDPENRIPRKPKNLWGKIVWWWRQNVMLDKYDIY